VEMCVADRRRRGRPDKVYICVISIKSQVDIAMAVCTFFDHLDLRGYKV